MGLDPDIFDAQIQGSKVAAAGSYSERLKAAQVPLRMAKASKTFVEGLFAYRGALQAFFYRRLRTKADAADLVQEVYLRMLRVSDPASIHNPEAYLFTVAANLLKENAVADRRPAQEVSVEAAEAAPALTLVPGFEAGVDAPLRVARLRAVIEELPLKCSAAVILQYRDGLSHQDIAAQLEVSPRMVKRYLAQALSHCRRRMARLR
jgi:RNA polymerase sigma factor (sigma-70 family)